MKAQELLERAKVTADPERAMGLMLEDLEAVAVGAQRWQASEEEFLAEAVDAMQRRERARRAAERARAEASRMEALKHAEHQRLLRNAQQRERYWKRRLEGGQQPDRRVGMHALRIEVDAAAWRTLKAEVVRRRSTIPRVLGEILSTTLADDEEKGTSAEPRWRRTGDGRRAKQFTRIELGEPSWTDLREDAVLRSMTLARWIGIAVEGWAVHQSDGGPSQ